MNGIHDKTLCYLTKEAATAVKEMIDAGLDRDLAVSVLERLWSEDAIYSIEEEENEG